MQKRPVITDLAQWLERLFLEFEQSRGLSPEEARFKVWREKMINADPPTDAVH